MHTIRNQKENEHPFTFHSIVLMIASLVFLVAYLEYEGEKYISARSINFWYLFSSFFFLLQRRKHWLLPSRLSTWVIICCDEKKEEKKRRNWDFNWENGKLSGNNERKQTMLKHHIGMHRFIRSVKSKCVSLVAMTPSWLLSKLQKMSNCTMFSR